MFLQVSKNRVYCKEICEFAFNILYLGEMKHIETNYLQPEDIGILFSLLKSVAIEQGNFEAVETTPEQLLEDAFGSSPKFKAIIAKIDGKVAGFALYFYLYSGWKGIRTVYIEDLFVLPELRRQKVGSALLKKIAAIANGSNMNLAWETERENYLFREFYLELGATDRAHKVDFYLGGEALEQMASLR